MLLELAASELERDFKLELGIRPLFVIQRGNRLDFRSYPRGGMIRLDFMFAPRVDGLGAAICFGALHELAHWYIHFDEPVLNESWANLGALHALHILVRRPFPFGVKLGYLYKDYIMTLVLLHAVSLLPGRNGDISRATLELWNFLRREGTDEIQRLLQRQQA